MATPTYKGTGQPVTSGGGWLSGIGSWFGATPPVYGSAATTKPVAAGTSVPAPSASGSATGGAVVASCDADRITLVIPRELIDSQQLAATATQDGSIWSSDAERITLVIPRALIQPTT